MLHFWKLLSCFRRCWARYMGHKLWGFFCIAIGNVLSTWRTCSGKVTADQTAGWTFGQLASDRSGPSRPWQTSATRDFPQNYRSNWKGFGVGTLHITCELLYRVSRACAWLLPADLLSPGPWVLVGAPAPKGAWKPWCQEHFLRAGSLGRQGDCMGVGGGKEQLAGLERLLRARLIAGDQAVTKTSFVCLIRWSKAPVLFVCHRASEAVINSSAHSVALCWVSSCGTLQYQQKDFSFRWAPSKTVFAPLPQPNRGRTQCYVAWSGLAWGEVRERGAPVPWGKRDGPCGLVNACSILPEFRARTALPFNPGQQCATAWASQVQRASAQPS